MTKGGNSGPSVEKKLHQLRPMVLLSRLIHSERSTRRGACAVSHGLKQALRSSSHVREMAMKQVSILLTDHTRWGQGSSLPLPPIHSRNDSVWPADAALTDIYVIVFLNETWVRFFFRTLFLLRSLPIPEKSLCHDRCSGRLQDKHPPYAKSNCQPPPEATRPALGLFLNARW